MTICLRIFKHEIVFKGAGIVRIRPLDQQSESVNAKVVRKILAEIQVPE